MNNVTATDAAKTRRRAIIFTWREVDTRSNPITPPRDPARLAPVESEPDQPHEPVAHEKKMAARLGMRASATAEVQRGLNGIRLAVLGIVVGIALTVAFGVQAAWWMRVLLGIGTFASPAFCSGGSRCAPR